MERKRKILMCEHPPKKFKSNENGNYFYKIIVWSDNDQS